MFAVSLNCSWCVSSESCQGTTFLCNRGTNLHVYCGGGGDEVCTRHYLCRAQRRTHTPASTGRQQSQIQSCHHPWYKTQTKGTHPHTHTRTAARGPVQVAANCRYQHLTKLIPRPQLECRHAYNRLVLTMMHVLRNLIHEGALDPPTVSCVVTQFPATVLTQVQGKSTNLVISATSCQKPTTRQTCAHWYLR